MIIAIDGPAGAGKSTIATGVARELGFQLINTGAMYRVVAHRGIQLGIPEHDGPALASIAAGLSFSFEFDGDGQALVFCNNERVGDEIRLPAVSASASVVSAHPEVREALLNIQRELATAYSCVMEGRDIGTVVFPDADVKIFLTASPEERAHRRVEQLRLAGEDSEFEEILDEIQTRDSRDSKRAVAPLVKASDAIEIDSTQFEVTEVIEKILEIAKTRQESS